jgi:hypothetical protein
VLIKHTMELETQGKTLLCMIARRRGRGDTSKPIPREFDINPRIILVGKIFSFYDTLRLESQWIDDYTFLVLHENTSKFILTCIIIYNAILTRLTRYMLLTCTWFSENFLHILIVFILNVRGRSVVKFTKYINLSFDVIGPKISQYWHFVRTRA